MKTKDEIQKEALEELKKHNRGAAAKSDVMWNPHCPWIALKKDE